MYIYLASNISIIKISGFQRNDTFQLATAHGEGTCDGLGGTVKHLVFSYIVAIGISTTSGAVPFSRFNTILKDVKNLAMAKLRAWLLQFSHLVAQLVTQNQDI